MEKQKQDKELGSTLGFNSDLIPAPTFINCMNSISSYIK